MSPRNALKHFYHLLYRLFLAKLPEATQRSLIGGLLVVAQRIHPSGRWPTSPDVLLDRRRVLAPSKNMRTLPDWAVEDLQDLALRVDPLLNRESVLAQQPNAFMTPVHWTGPGQAYERIRRRIGNRRFDTIVLVPWLKRGGADLGALHHAKACVEAFGQRTLVIATEDGDSPWANRLDEATPFIDIGAELLPLSVTHGEHEIVLARLLLQLAPTRVHIINSRTAWRVVERYGKAIRQKTRIFASLYCDEFSADGRREGLAQQYLPTCWRWLDAVISDNSASPAEWQATIGVDPALFKVVHFPAPAASTAAIYKDHLGSQPRLLWASRLERQKRPDLLVALVSALPEFHWDIHGAALTKDDPYLAELRTSSNVSLHGSYEDFASIVRPDHLAYIYTSSWDGLPNVLLEAASAGVPVVAPDIGGIRDLVPRQQLVPAGADVDDYAAAIRGLNQPGKRDAWQTAQHDNLREFTWERFISMLRNIPGYAS